MRWCFSCGDEMHTQKMYENFFQYYDRHVQFCKELDEIGIAYQFEDWHAKHDFLCFDEALKRTVFKFKL